MIVTLGAIGYIQACEGRIPRHVPCIGGCFIGSSRRVLDEQVKQKQGGVSLHDACSNRTQRMRKVFSCHRKPLTDEKRSIGHPQIFPFILTNDRIRITLRIERVNAC